MRRQISQIVTLMLKIIKFNNNNLAEFSLEFIALYNIKLYTANLQKIYIFYINIYIYIMLIYIMLF